MYEIIPCKIEFTQKSCVQRLILETRLKIMIFEYDILHIRIYMILTM
jgi:hypothetical protein